MPLRAIARLIQTMLYAQRFFPYYVYNILGGIEEDGTRPFPRSRRCVRDSPRYMRTFPGSGAVYSFDPVGSYEREACRAAGAASSLVQPFLDNQVRLLLLLLPTFPSLRPSVPSPRARRALAGNRHHYHYLPSRPRPTLTRRTSALSPALAHGMTFSALSFTRVHFVFFSSTADILQESNSCAGRTTPDASAASRCLVHRRRLVYKRDGTPH